MDNVVLGHLCQDPILRQSKRGGQPFARFTVATNVWRREGNKFVQRPPVFHRVLCFGLQAENVMRSLRKGMEVMALGEFVDDSYSDEQGQRKVEKALEAKAVAPSLRWATATVTKVERQPDAESDATVVEIGPRAEGAGATESDDAVEPGGEVHSAADGRHRRRPSITDRARGLFDPDVRSAAPPTPPPTPEPIGARRA